jgi:UDP-glucose 4-epimerase
LVTGGAGFIGSNLSNALPNITYEDRRGETLKDGANLENYYDNGNRTPNNNGNIGNNNEVIALDDLSLGTPSNLSKRVKFVNGSVMNYELVLELGERCDYIFHQAAFSSSPMFVDDPRRGVDVNVMGFMNVMESAKRNKVKKVIYASSSSLYNGLRTPFRESANIIPRTFYESSFYCREMIARTYNLEHGVDSIGLRYFSVYGPNEKHKGRFANNISQFIWDLLEKKSPVIFGNGSQTRDFTFVDDVVQANILAMGKNQLEGSAVDIDNNKDSEYRKKKNACRGSSIYNIGTGKQTSFNTVIEIINKQLGINIRPTYVDNPINNYVQHTMADISLAGLELGYEPKWINVEDGIKHLLMMMSR